MPTDEGYRVYVDSPDEPASLWHGGTPPPSSRELRPATASPAQVMENGLARCLSRLSRNVGFVLAPDIAAHGLAAHRPRAAAGPARSWW